MILFLKKFVMIFEVNAENMRGTIFFINGRSFIYFRFDFCYKMIFAYMKKLLMAHYYFSRIAFHQCS